MRSDIIVEFKNFDAKALATLTSINTKGLRVVYSSGLIEHLGELYYELGDYEKPIVFSSKPIGEDYVATYYDNEDRVIKATSYNFNNILLSDYYYLYSNEMIKCYEIDEGELIQLDVLILKNNQKSDYYRYSPLGGIDTVNQYIYENDKLISINSFSANYLVDQQTEFSMSYENNKLSEIVRIDEVSKIFPNGQTLSIYPAKGK